jgi:predicted metal-binding membrane protein
MLALLMLGVMDLAVMAIVAAVIAVEKLAPDPRPFVRLSGVAALVIGVIQLLRPIFF